MCVCVGVMEEDVRVKIQDKIRKTTEGGTVLLCLFRDLWLL